MPHIGIRELQRDTSDVLRRVADGNRLVITRHNRPVAVILGIADARRSIRRLRGFDRIKRGEFLRAFEDWIWSGDQKPLNVLIAELSGDQPVREFPHED